MSGYPTVNFSESEEGLFAPHEILRLMRIEYERAQRYNYPAALMLVSVDRIEYLHDLYGWESKEEILQAIIGALRATMRDSDFLGCMQDDRIMAVFPHTSEDTITAIATRFLRVCRDLDFQTDGRSIRASVSIGIATVERGSKLDFEGFVGTAEEAVAFAIESGGDRFVRRESAVDVIDELRGEIEAEADWLSHEREHPAEEQRAVPSIEDLPETQLGEALRDVFREHGHGVETLELENAIVRTAEGALHRARADGVPGATGGHGSQIETLERRVAKLRDLLDQSETALGDLAATKGVEAGIASIYRTVQGLQPDEKGQKKEMLSLIFEANLELQKKKKPGS
jgi:diguanylate cyclase (GGDEF)-like protein